MLKSLAIILGGMLAAGSARAESWAFLGFENNNTQYIGVDMESLVATGDVVRGKVAIVLKDRINQADFLLDTVEVDCSNENVTILDRQKRMGSSNFVPVDEARTSLMYYYYNGGEALYSTVCGNRDGTMPEPDIVAASLNAFVSHGRAVLARL